MKLALTGMWSVSQSLYFLCTDKSWFSLWLYYPRVYLLSTFQCYTQYMGWKYSLSEVKTASENCPVSLSMVSMCTYPILNVLNLVL